jgi:rubrerythrin
MYPEWRRPRAGEGFDEIADWFETLAKAERSHANRFRKPSTYWRIRVCARAGASRPTTGISLRGRARSSRRLDLENASRSVTMP